MIHWALNLCMRRKNYLHDKFFNNKKCLMQKDRAVLSQIRGKRSPRDDDKKILGESVLRPPFSVKKAKRETSVTRGKKGLFFTGYPVTTLRFRRLQPQGADFRRAEQLGLHHRCRPRAEQLGLRRRLWLK